MVKIGLTTLFFILLISFNFCFLTFLSIPKAKATETLNLHVSSGNDDAWENGEGEFYNDGSFLMITSYYTTAKYMYRCAGTLFQNVTIPQNTTILSADYSIYPHTGVYDYLRVYVYGNDVNNSANFNTTPHVISPTYRPRTSAKVSWEDYGHAHSWISRDVTPVVQEIIDRAGWQSGNNLTLLLIAKVAPLPYKACDISAYEGGECEGDTWGNGEKSAKLDIEWEEKETFYPKPFVDRYTMLGIGLAGLILMAWCPTWIALKFRKKGLEVETVETFGYAMLLFFVGFGFFIIWIYS